MRRYLSLCMGLMALLYLPSLASSDALRTRDPKNYHQKLSDYGLFKGKLADLQPNEQVKPYILNNTSFTDYAHKLRFVVFPKGKQAELQPDFHFSFPVGTILVKNFYYPADFAKPKEQWRIIETRILLREADGWIPLCYVWEEDQTEAYLNIAGSSRYISWKDEKGQMKKLNYRVPSLLECQSCHGRNNEINPLGISVRQLNAKINHFAFAPTEQGKEQMELWKAWGFIAASTDVASLPRKPIWNDPSTGDLNTRARTWLDVNCAHCHSPGAYADLTRFYLNFAEKDPLRLGINKKTSAANDADMVTILPGNPDRSYLIRRLESKDPHTTMSQVATQLANEEAIALIRQWVQEMK